MRANDIEGQSMQNNAKRELDRLEAQAMAAEQQEAQDEIFLYGGAGSENPPGAGGPASGAQESAMLAALICQALAKGAEIRWPVLNFEQAVIEQGSEKLAPVLAKYGASAGFLEAYKVEIEAGMFFGAVIYQCHKKIKEEAAAKSEKAKNEPESTS